MAIYSSKQANRSLIIIIAALHHTILTPQTTGPTPFAEHLVHAMFLLYAPSNCAGFQYHLSQLYRQAGQSLSLRRTYRGTAASEARMVVTAAAAAPTRGRRRHGGGPLLLALVVLAGGVMKAARANNGWQQQQSGNPYYPPPPPPPPPRGRPPPPPHQQQQQVKVD